MRQKKFITLALSTFGIASALVGCGASGVSSGVDQSKKASEVTTDEAKKICEATADYTEGKITASDACRAIGAPMAAFAFAAGSDDATIQKACQDAVDACVQEAEKEPVDSTSCDSAAAMPNCTATVGEVETCLTDTIDAGAEALKSVPACSTYTKAYFENPPETTTTDLTTPESCKALKDTCPALGGIDDTDDDDGYGGAGGAG